MVVEVAVDVARGAAGRWRHPVRLHRPRLDVPAGVRRAAVADGRHALERGRARRLRADGRALTGRRGLRGRGRGNSGHCAWTGRILVTGCRCQAGTYGPTSAGRYGAARTAARRKRTQRVAGTCLSAPRGAGLRRAAPRRLPVRGDQMRVGITGRRGLDDQADNRVCALLAEAVKADDPGEQVGVACLADGPDSWCAETSPTRAAASGPSSPPPHTATAFPTGTTRPTTGLSTSPPASTKPAYPR
jgi:hypothetical protein